MAVVFCEVGLSDNVVEFSGSSQQDVEECKRFWQSTYLQPQSESALVCSEIDQRLSKHSMAPSPKYSRNSSQAVPGTYKYVTVPSEQQLRTRNLAEKREVTRKRFETLRSTNREKDKPRLDLQTQIFNKKLADTEQRELQSARDEDLRMCAELAAEISMFENGHNIIYDDDENGDAPEFRHAPADFPPEDEPNQD